MTDTLEELERLLKAATPGPWINCGGRVSTAYFSRDSMDEGDPLQIADCDIDTRIDHDTTGEANAALIVAAINALPRLIESARQPGISTSAAILVFRQWLADEGLVIVPAEPTPKMLEANSNCTTPELWAGIGWAAMIAAAPDVLGKP